MMNRTILAASLLGVVIGIAHALTLCRLMGLALDTSVSLEVLIGFGGLIVGWWLAIFWLLAPSVDGRMRLRGVIGSLVPLGGGMGTLGVAAQFDVFGEMCIGGAVLSTIASSILYRLHQADARSRTDARSSDVKRMSMAKGTLMTVGAFGYGLAQYWLISRETAFHLTPRLVVALILFAIGVVAAAGAILPLEILRRRYMIAGSVLLIVAGLTGTLAEAGSEAWYALLIVGLPATLPAVTIWATSNHLERVHQSIHKD